MQVEGGCDWLAPQNHVELGKAVLTGDGNREAISQEEENGMLGR